MPLKVCYVIDQLRTGGTETHLLRLIDNLDRKSIVPHLCLLDGEGNESRMLEPEHCPVVRLGVNSLLSTYAFRQLVRFRRQLRDWNIDLVQVHFPDSTYFGVLAAKLAGVCRVVRTRRDLFYWVTPTHLRYGKFIDRLYNCFFVDRLLTNCRACQQAACEGEQLSESMVEIIDNGIDLGRVLSIPEPSSHSSEQKQTLQIGAVSMLRPEKRLDLFVAAASQISKQFPHVVFSVAGDGCERERLRKRIVEQGLSTQFSMLGIIKNVPDYLSGLDVWVLCSDTEGQSNALIEAMAAGRAVVATAVGGNIELIDNRVNGLLITPNDPVALASALKELIEDQSLRLRLATNARRSVAERFSVRKMVEQHQQLYAKLCFGSEAARQPSRCNNAFDGQSAESYEIEV